MSNLNTLADEYAALKSMMDEHEKRLKALRSELLATGLEVIEGEKAVVVVGLSERKSLDTSAVKQLLTADQIDSCTKTSLVETLRIKPRL